MRTVAAAVMGCLVLGLTWLGCSSTDNQPKGAADAGGKTDGGRDPNLNCVKPGTKSNERGVGAYCESSADCVSDAIGFFLCSADFPSTPKYSWFCTMLCNVDADCGTNAFCGHSDLGNGCVPNACGTPSDAGPPDAEAGGGDGPLDVSMDSAPDVAPEASPDVAPEATPDVARDVTMETSDDAPDVPADTSTEASVDAADAGSVEAASD